MTRVEVLTDELREKIVAELYKDELFNIFSISEMEQPTLLEREIYISPGPGITEVHISGFDGNSFLTTFHTRSRAGLEKIAAQLQEIKKEKLLLGGPA